MSLARALSLLINFFMSVDALLALEDIATKIGDSNLQCLLGLLFIGKKHMINAGLQAETNIQTHLSNLEISYEKAAKYFKLSADQGCQTSHFYLGVLFYYGFYVSLDYEQAFYHFKCSADKGNFEAQYNLCVMYYLGKGVLRDLEKCIFYLKLAAFNGYVKGQLFLFLLFLEIGEELLNMNFREAFEYCTKAANQGNLEAQFIVCTAYLTGRNVIEQNLPLSFHYGLLSANQGDADAQYIVGTFYRYGIPTTGEKDYSRAIHYYKSSSDQGNSYSQLELGILYKKGKGIEEDLNEALRLIQLSASSGNPKALLYLEKWNEQ